MTVSLSSLFRGWRATALLVVVVCLSPQRVAAEGGDHVRILNTSVDSDLHAMPGPAEKPAPLPPPCQGPNCSSAPERPTPLFPPVTPVGLQGKEVIRSLGLNDQPENPGFSFDHDFTSLRPIRRPASIFHPPRVG